MSRTPHLLVAELRALLDQLYDHIEEMDGHDLARLEDDADNLRISVHEEYARRDN